MSDERTEPAVATVVQQPRAAQPHTLAAPQYIQGFEGAASVAFSAEAAAVLAAPVNEAEVETKPNGIVYLPGVWYRRQLIRAFGPGAWALLPRQPARKMEEIVIYPGALYILGRFVSEAVGECEARFGMSYASALEGARTDALTRCCKDLGMATELWDPDWREGWQAKWTTKEWVADQKSGKGKYVFEKLSRPNNAPAPVGGRNAATPTQAAEDQAGQMSAEPVAELATEGDAEMLRTAVTKLGWTKPKARSWLKATFGQSMPVDLKKAQAADALSLLLAAQVGDDDAAYSAAYDALKAAGRVL
jgi:hypothetical protein